MLTSKALSPARPSCKGKECALCSVSHSPPPKQGHGGRQKGATSYSKSEDLFMLRNIKEVAPTGADGWKKVAELHKEVFDSPVRTAPSIKQRFDRLSRKKKPTGKAQLDPVVALVLALKAYLEQVAQSKTLNDDNVEEEYDGNFDEEFKEAMREVEAQDEGSDKDEGLDKDEGSDKDEPVDVEPGSEPSGLPAEDEPAEEPGKPEDEAARMADVSKQDACEHNDCEHNDSAIPQTDQQAPQQAPVDALSSDVEELPPPVFPHLIKATTASATKPLLYDQVKSASLQVKTKSAPKPIASGSTSKLVPLKAQLLSTSPAKSTVAPKIGSGASKPSSGKVSLNRSSTIRLSTSKPSPSNSKLSVKPVPKPKVSRQHSSSNEPEMILDDLETPEIVKKAPKKPKVTETDSEGEQVVKKRKPEKSLVGTSRGRHLNSNTTGSAIADSIQADVKAILKSGSPAALWEAAEERQNETFAGLSFMHSNNRIESLENQLVAERERAATEREKQQALERELAESCIESRVEALLSRAGLTSTSGPPQQHLLPPPLPPLLPPPPQDFQQMFHDTFQEMMPQMMQMMQQQQPAIPLPNWAPENNHPANGFLPNNRAAFSTPHSVDQHPVGHVHAHPFGQPAPFMPHSGAQDTRALSEPVFPPGPSIFPQTPNHGNRHGGESSSNVPLEHNEH